MTAQPDIRPRHWLMIALLSFVWGGTFMVTEIALEGITPFWLAASRIGFGALLSWIVWRRLGGHLFDTAPEPSQWVALVLVGTLSSAIPFMLLAWGQQSVTAGFAGVAMASAALVILILAHFFVPGEGLTVRRSIGFAIGFVGVVVLIGSQAFESSGATHEFAGRMACVGAACCYATSSILMRRLPPVDPIGLSCVLLFIGLMVVLPTALILEGPPPKISLQTLGVLAFLGLIPTAAANFLRVLVVRSAGPVFMSLVNYQVPLWSVLLGALILSEPLPPSLFWAMALILSGVGLSQYGALKRLFTKN